MENNISINIKNMSKVIKGTVILDNINLQLESKKIYGFVGRNGSGKTMLFKVICGLSNPTNGEISVFGKIINNGEFPDEFGAIIENPGFIPNQSGFNNLKLLASIKNKIHDQDIITALDKVNLIAKDKKHVRKYSLGMKQRLGIAQDIMEKPKLLILDEPMNALDKEGVQLIRNLLIELKNTGVTILIATHNSDDVKLLCDKVFEMDNGVLKEILIE